MHVIAVRYVGWRFLSLLHPAAGSLAATKRLISAVKREKIACIPGRGSFAATALDSPQPLVTIAQVRIRFQL